MKFESEQKELKVMNQGWRGVQSVHDRLQAMIDKVKSECNGKFYKTEFMDFLVTAGMDTIEGTSVPGPATEKLLNEREPEKPKPKVKRFVKPSDIDIRDYMINKGFGHLQASTEAEKLFNYYESNGWKVGKNPMKNWKAAAANWMKGSSLNKPSYGKPAVDQSGFGDSQSHIDGEVIPNQPGLLENG